MRHSTITGTSKRCGLGFGLGAAFLLAATSASAATITVNSLEDVVDNAEPCTLREAIINANGNLVATNGCAAGDALGDDIVFDVSGTITLNGTQLPTLLHSVTTDPLTITGPITIDADGQSRIFTNAGITTLANLTLINGAANGSANPDNSGGAILNTTSGVLTVMGGAMNNNTAVRAGGAIEEASGVATGTTPAVTLTDVDFSGNNAGDSPGNGGVLHVSGQGDVVVSGGTFDANVAMEGGALWNGTGSMTVTDSMFTGNRANGSAASQGGGALFNNGGSLTVNTATITGNSAPGTLSDAAGSNGSGGGILNNGGTLTVNASTISNNSAVRAGGGIEDDSREIASIAVTLNNVTMDGNSAGPSPGNGGAVHISGAGNMTVNGGSFTNNVAANEGGGLWNFGTATMTIDGTTDENGAVLIGGNAAQGVDAANGGGGLFNNGGTMDVDGAVISNNTAGPASGDANPATGSSSGGGILNSDGGSLTVVNTVISGNSALRAGGGIETRDGSDVSLSVVSLQGNTVGPNPGNGGGLHVTENAEVNVLSTLVASNTATAEGGGLWNGAGPMTVSSSSILNNTASGDGSDQGGGGIYNLSGTVDIGNSRIIGNVADGSAGSGGGILNDVGATTTVTGGAISANSAVRAGGGIENNAGSVSLARTTLGGTDATFGNIVNGPPGNGGGLHTGGAGTANLTASTVAFNTAVEGGGLWNSSGGTLQIDNSTISNNQATDSTGGGIHQDGDGAGTTTGNFVTVTRNTASGAGGGVAAPGSSTATLNNSLIAENSADDSAGNVATDADTDSLTSANAGLDVLQLFGGTTATQPLLANSAAVDSIADANCTGGFASDQRGALRRFDSDNDTSTGNCDAGAYELTDNAVITVTNNNSTPVTVTPNSTNVVVLDLTLANNSDASITVGGYSGNLDVNQTLPSGFDLSAITLGVFADANDNGSPDSGERINATATVNPDLTFTVQFDGGAGVSFAAGDAARYLLAAQPTTTATTAEVTLMPVYAGSALLGILGLFSIGGMRRRTQWLLLIAVVTVGLAACGGGGSGSIGGNNNGGNNNNGAGPIQGGVQYVAVTVDAPDNSAPGDFIIGDGMPVRGPALTLSSQ